LPFPFFASNLKIMLTTDEIMTLKESIYSVLTDKEILSFYLGISIGEIDNLLSNKSNRISNPLRFDLNPSLGMMLRYTSNGSKIIVKDFADITYTGDVFDIVGIITNNNPNTREGFISICNTIMNDLVLRNSDINIIPTGKQNINKDNKTVYHNDNIPFVVFNDKGWTNDTLRFWHNHTKNKTFTKHLYDILRLEQVYIPESIFSNDKLIYSFNSTDIAYLYFYGTNHLNNSIVKVYFPYRNRGYTLSTTKFFTNDISKVRNLNTNTAEANILIVTKSMKDSLFLRTFTIIANLSTKVNIAYVQGEENYLNKYEYSELTNGYDTVIWFMDFDKTGIYNTIYHLQLDPKIIPFFIPSKEVIIKTNDLTYTATKLNKQFGTTISSHSIQLFIESFPVRPYLKGVKDFADMLEVKGLFKTIAMFKILVKSYLRAIVE